jgi:hypothetical protein
MPIYHIVASDENTFYVKADTLINAFKKWKTFLINEVNIKPQDISEPLSIIQICQDYEYLP